MAGPISHSNVANSAQDHDVVSSFQLEKKSAKFTKNVDDGDTTARLTLNKTI